MAVEIDRLAHLFTRYSCPKCKAAHNQGPRRYCQPCFRSTAEQRRKKLVEQQKVRREARRALKAKIAEREQRKAVDKALREANPVPPSDQVLNAMRQGLRTWDELKKSTGLDSDRLSDVLARLYDHDRIRPVAGAAVRTYKLL